jgi:hypothetical protein
MQTIPERLQQHPELKTNLEKAVHEIFLKVDKEIRSMAFMEVSVLLYSFLDPFNCLPCTRQIPTLIVPVVMF